MIDYGDKYMLVSTDILLEVLNFDGMGIVYLGLEAETSEDVSLKP